MDLGRAALLLLEDVRARPFSRSPATRISSSAPNDHSQATECLVECFLIARPQRAASAVTSLSKAPYKPTDFGSRVTTRSSSAPVDVQSESMDILSYARQRTDASS